ncbi:hypothetical protein JIR001_26810 [Polycladomyces abyssicola]|jgi:hypothetical protein|uniref:Uncharacterized protein n=1 Tax=Polycladomyces abyssicola TaxID=1125966 RepID=A0A8D5UIW9_9BACL|nr:hypothetical protein [Polycladomyces abyssicola]BCU82898.1 hypothetical protein JIR001_26810 [Polycladomyces abyssicola]
MKDRYQKLEEYKETMDKGFKSIRIELEKIRHEIEHFKINPNIHKAGAGSNLSKSMGIDRNHGIKGNGKS